MIELTRRSIERVRLGLERDRDDAKQLLKELEIQRNTLDTLGALIDAMPEGMIYHAPDDVPAQSDDGGRTRP
jgi:hypothetical protein